MNKEPGFFGVSRLPPAGVAGLILSGTTCRRQAVHTCTSQAVLTQPPRQQPLRPGPHDVDPGQPRQQPWFDILDVQVYVGIFLYELLERAISRHSFPLPGAELCFILLVAELCALLVHVRWHRPLASGRHKPRPPSWACVLLGFSTMLPVSTAAPARSGAHTGAIGLGVPAQSSLELWQSGQLTLGEQLAAAMQRHALSPPLSSGGLDPSQVHPDGPPVFDRQARAPIPDEIAEPPFDLPEFDNEPEVTTHVSFLIFAPFFETETVDIAMAFPLQIDRTLEFVKESVHLFDKPWLSEMLFTQPQLYDECGSILRIPEWVLSSGKYVILIDASHVGKGTFAVYHQGPVTRASVLCMIEVALDYPADVFAFGALAPPFGRFPGSAPAGRPHTGSPQRRGRILAGGHSVAVYRPGPLGSTS